MNAVSVTSRHCLVYSYPKIPIPVVIYKLKGAASLGVNYLRLHMDL